MNIAVKTFEKLLNTQKEFDSRVVLENEKSTRVAYLVEFIEWINTREFFKDWKQNKGKSQEKQLDELADLLAFGLSIGLQEGVTTDNLVNLQNDYQKPNKYINTDNVLFIISELSSDLANKEFDEYYLVMLPLMLAEDFYTVDQLVNAYYKKMQVNHNRQNNNY
ncbi:dUTP diphosphatase [Lysinibacillus sp. NPDC092081]|uniref:dUTP diphosphatase n=1 Tax=Lysinibacillus sp. NPDC092081 TaxID=3364131 RepID=UPI003818624A